MEEINREILRRINAEYHRRITSMLCRWQSELEPQVFQRNVPMTVVIGSDSYEMHTFMPIGLGPVGHSAPCITWGDA